MPNELDENEKPELSNLVLGTNEVYYEYDGKYFKRKVIVNKNLVCNLKDKNGNSLGVIRNEKTYALVEPTESEIPKNKIFVGWKITINGIEKIVSKENNIFTCEDGTIEGTEVIIEPKFESTIFVVNINKDVGIEKVIPVGCTEKESNKKYECPFDSLINLEVYSNVGYTVSTIVSDNSKASIKYLSSSNNKKTYSLENNELEEVILTASSTVNSYTITYNASGGSPATSSKTISYNTNYILPSNPTKSCGTFKGWFTEATGGTQITASTIMNRVENHTVYAQWDSNTSSGSWGTCSGGTCSGCSVATNSGTQTNTCGATRSCTPTKDCTSAGSWGTCSGGSCSGCSAASYSGSQRNSCGATRSCTPSLNCSTNGYWQGCSGGYCSGCSAAAYSGTEYNTCGGSRSCTPSLDCSSNAQVYTGSYYCGGATCGYAYCQNSCGGQTYTYLGQCVSLYCNAYMGQSTFSCNASPVSAPAQAQANMSLTSCALYGCKNSCGCSVMGQYATASGGTIGTYPCSQWAGSHTLTFYVYSSSGSASCSTSYYVTN